MRDMYHEAWETLNKFILKYRNDIPADLFEINRFKQKDPLRREREYVNNHIERYVATLGLFPIFKKRVNVLDIGVAFGHLAILIKEQLGHKVFCIDVERDETPYWRRRLEKEGIIFKPCDLTKDAIPFESEAFDVVLFCEVLEHLTTHPSLVFKEINRVCKKGGTLILSTPNFTYLLNRILTLCGKTPQSIEFTKGKGAEHFRLYTANEVTRILQLKGFKIDTVQYWSPPMRRIKGITRKFFYMILSVKRSFREYILVKAEKLQNDEDYLTS